ncbi:Exonuclease domain-containing protein [Balamuthia mandrillaris]
MVVVMLRSVGEQLYTKYSSCFSSLKLQKDGGAFSQMAPFSSPGSKYRVFETLYALLAVQKQSKSSKKSLKRKRESLPNALLIPGDVKASFKKFKQSHEPSPSSEKEHKEDEEGTIVLNITSTSSSSPSSPSSSSSSKSKCSFLEPFILTMAQLKQNKFPLENYPPPKLQNITDKEEEEEEEEAEEEGNFYRGAEEEKEQKETTNPYEGYVSTKSSRREAASSSATPSGPRLLAIDCEMCLTAKGSELTRCSVIDDSHNVLYDELVLPDSPIIDYLTKYSGITAEKLEGVTTRLKDVQEALLSLITPDTVLVGHSLENDLTALKLFHDRIIDTSVLYPHPTEPEMKQSLRFLVQKYLRRNIQQQQLQQTSAVGHDSVEDAIACMELAQLKIIRGTHFGSAFEEAAVLSGNHNANNNGLNSEGIKTLFSVLQKHNNQTLMVDRNYVLRKYLPLVPPVDQVPLSSPLPSPPLEEEWKISGKRKGKKQLIPVVSVACLNNDDEEITEKLVSKLEHLQQVPDQPKTFLLSQLHAIEDHLSGKDLMREKFKANVQKQQQQLPEQKQKENEETQGEENGRHLEEEDREEALKSKLRQLDNNIKRIYDAMPQNGLLIVCPAREHLDAVCRLQKQKQQEGSNWTQEQDVELANSVAAVRNGLAFFTVKQTCDTP